MYIHSLFAAAAFLEFVSVAGAATSPGLSTAVPADLSGGFKPQDATLQVSFDNQSDAGVPNGAQLTSEQTSQAPTFALGDSSGVNTAIKWVIFMVDTTSSTDRVLHYVQSDFQATEIKTAIASKTQPQMSWKGPGSLGEAGDRQYTFLLYEQPGSFTAQGLPQAGQPINVQQFVKQNGLSKAIAGQTILVNLNSTSGSTSGPVEAPKSSATGPAAAIVTPGSGGVFGLVSTDGISSTTIDGAALSSALNLPSSTTSSTTATATANVSPSTSAPAHSSGSSTKMQFPNAYLAAVRIAAIAVAAGLLL